MTDVPKTRTAAALKKRLLELEKELDRAERAALDIEVTAMTLRRSERGAARVVLKRTASAANAMRTAAWRIREAFDRLEVL